MKPSLNKPPPSSSTAAAAYFHDTTSKLAAVNSTLAPRAEDYSEIFSGFRTSSSSRASSSIPVLDLPAVNAAEYDGSLDYDAVFGGMCAVDFAVPFDELFRSSDGFDASDNDDDAWTPIGTESLSDDSDPFAFSEKSQCFSNGNSNQPLEGNQYNVSYHKVNPGTSTCASDAIHVAQLNNVPGYTCVVEEAASLREVDEKFCSQTFDDIVLNVEPPPIITQKHVKKTSSNISHEDTGFKSFDIDPRPCRTRSVDSISPSDNNLPTKSSHFTPPSRSPAEKNRGVNGLSPSPKGSENYDYEATNDDSLPPFFDMEIDASSSAAVSAAAMKDVMDKAQAKLKAAREFRGRKDTFQNGGEVSSETDVHGGESVELPRSESISDEKSSHAPTDRGAKNNKGYSKERHGRNVSQILPDSLADEQPVGVNVLPARSDRNLPKDTDLSDAGGEWKAESQYFEFVNNDSSRSANQPPSNGGEKNETFKREDNNDNESDSDSAGESFVMQNNRRRLKAVKAVSRQGYYEKMVKVAQEVHNTVTSGHVEIKEELQGTFHGDHKEQKSKLAEPEKDEVRVWGTYPAEATNAEVIKKVEVEMKTKNVPQNENVEISNHRGLNGSRIDPPVNVSKEAVKGTFEREESGRGAHESIVELSTEALKQRKNKKSREVKEKRPDVAFGGVFGGKRPQTTFESDENGGTEDMKKMKAEGWGPTEASEDKIAQKRLEKIHKGQENFTTTQVPQIFKHDEHLGNATNGSGSEMMLDRSVELEKCWEYLETLEQEKNRLNSDKVHTPVENHLAEGRKIAKEEDNLVETSEKGNVQSKLKQAREVGESVNICDKTNFDEDLNSTFRSHMETEGEEEDQVADSSSDNDLSINDKHPKLSVGVNLNGEDAELNAVLCASKPSHVKVNGSLDVSSGKENGEIDSTLLSDSKLKGFKTADVQIDSKELKCTTQAGLIGEELGGNDGPASLKLPRMKSDDSVEMSAVKENGDINILLSEETRSKAAETIDMIDEKQRVSRSAQEGLGNDDYERRPAHASHTLQSNEKNTKSCESSSHNQISTKDNIQVAHSASDPKLVKVPLERVEMTKKLGVGQVLRDEEKNVRPGQLERMNGWNGHPINRVGTHPVMPERKQSFQRTSQVSSLGQSIERNGSWAKHHNGSLDEKHEDTKTDLEKEHLRKLEEEREREREREKDKVAVEVAIREARERAYADARDRAERAALERATEELRQKAMTEARERLEKACAEARERSFMDKASEDRLRAERSAVERATAEARQRAIEKSIADRAMFETRERVQRTMSEKYISERDVIMRQSSFPSTSERSETGNSEPAQRCKARLERHRRTVERVAKALEEKNMRDLQTQREQSERNRFAETLDADIKRWSSGKAGNLRALLSTLQYILGPDSGWQPIPLTEVVTAAAVKKAYRKATLCVHPDKLQQRGASIQQKYISEKVFDLLKEAWNGFNSEEK